MKYETNIFLVLRNKLNDLLRFKANPSIDCDSPGECLHTGSMTSINEIISDRDHSQIAMIVSYGKDGDGVEGWYPKGFHQFENSTTGGTFLETIPLLHYHKTISSIIGECNYF